MMMFPLPMKTVRKVQSQTSGSDSMLVYTMYRSLHYNPHIYIHISTFITL